MRFNSVRKWRDGHHSTRPAPHSDIPLAALTAVRRAPELTVRTTQVRFSYCDSLCGPGLAAHLTVRDMESGSFSRSSSSAAFPGVPSDSCHTTHEERLWCPGSIANLVARAALRFACVAARHWTVRKHQTASVKGPPSF